MSKFLSNLKQSLTRNEIIFKTVAATTLSFMAVIVSTAQLLTAKQQLKLADLQAKIARANALPNFDISLVPKRDPKSGYYNEYHMMVINSGGPIHEVHAEAMFFLHASTVELGKFTQQIEVDIPINGYYFVQFSSAESKGEITHFMGKDNNSLMVQAERDAIALSKANGWPYLNFDERSYLHLRYRDLMGDPHSEYFRVYAVGGSSRLSEKEGEVLSKQWHQGVLLDVEDLKPGPLLAKIKASAK